MEINPLSSFNVNSDHRGRNSRPEKTDTPTESDSFSGPNVEEKKHQLSSLDGVRSEKVNDIKDQLEKGTYFSEDKLRKTIEALIKGV